MSDPLESLTIEESSMLYEVIDECHKNTIDWNEPDYAELWASIKKKLYNEDNFYCDCKSPCMCESAANAAGMPTSHDNTDTTFKVGDKLYYFGEKVELTYIIKGKNVLGLDAEIKLSNGELKGVFLSNLKRNS